MISGAESGMEGMVGMSEAILRNTKSKEFGRREASVREKMFGEMESVERNKREPVGRKRAFYRQLRDCVLSM